MDGVKINKTEFLSLKTRDRDAIFFDNQNDHKDKLDKILHRLNDNKTHKIIQYAWLFILTVALGFRKYIPL